MMSYGPAPAWAPKEGDVVLFGGEELECLTCDGWYDASQARFWGRQWDDPDPYSAGVACFIINPTAFTVVDRVENRKRPDSPTVFDVRVSLTKDDFVFDPDWHKKPNDEHGNLPPYNNSVTKDALHKACSGFGSFKMYSHSGTNFDFRIHDKAEAEAFMEKAQAIPNVGFVELKELRPLWERTFAQEGQEEVEEPHDRL